MSLSDLFPLGFLSEEKLSKLGGFPIENMGYYKLDMEGHRGIYEPITVKGEEKKYVLRRVIEIPKDENKN